MNVITTRNSSSGKVMLSQVSVSLFTGGGVRYLCYQVPFGDRYLWYQVPSRGRGYVYPGICDSPDWVPLFQG